MVEICFICTGNTCRSIMAEKIAQKKAKEQNLDLKITSAGLFADKNVVEDKTKQTLQILGYDDSGINSIQLEKIDPHVLYVAVTDAHKKYIQSAKVISFGDLAGEVEDPAGLPLEEYISTARKIEKNIDVLFEKMKKIRGEK